MKTMMFVLVVALASCSRVAAAGLETVRIGVCMSLTGDFASSGQTYLAGLEIGLAEANARAEANGYRVELLIRDDQSDPDVAVSLFRDLATKDKVAAVIGSNSTRVTLAMRAIARELKIPLVSPSATSPEIGRNDDWAFRVMFDDGFQGVALARYSRRQLGLRRAAVIINERFSYGDNIFKSFKKTFEEEGGAVDAVETYDCRLDEVESQDFTGMIEWVKLSDPETILLPNYVSEAAMVIRQSLKVSMSDDRGKPIRFCGGDAWHHDSLLLESGNNIEGSYYIGVLNEEDATPELRNFRARLDESNNLSAEMSSALGYDALSLLIEAMKRGRDPASIREGLYAIKDFPLVSGHITIDRAVGTLKPAYIITIKKSGDAFVRELTAIIEP